MTPRDIEKLKALGYSFNSNAAGCYVLLNGSVVDHQGGDEPWTVAQDHSQFEGLKATMADKVRWLDTSVDIYPDENRTTWVAQITSSYTYGSGQSPEAAVDALFWKVP